MYGACSTLVRLPHSRAHFSFAWIQWSKERSIQLAFVYHGVTVHRPALRPNSGSCRSAPLEIAPLRCRYQHRVAGEMHLLMLTCAHLSFSTSRQYILAWLCTSSIADQERYSGLPLASSGSKQQMLEQRRYDWGRYAQYARHIGSRDCVRSPCPTTCADYNFLLVTLTGRPSLGFAVPRAIW